MSATAEGTQLVRYDAACLALAEARATDEVLKIEDQARQWQAAAMVAKNRQMETDAAEIRVRAERRLGELIKAQKETVGLNQGTRGQLAGRDASGGAVKEPPDKGLPTLAEAKIDKKLSSRSQKLAALPTEEFEDRIATWRARAEYGTDRVAANVLREPAPAPLANVVSISHQPSIPNEHIDQCMATIRRLVLTALNDLEPMFWPELFKELRSEVADLRKIANKREKDGHHASRQSA